MSLKKSKYKPLPLQELANIYLQLARLEESGIPIQQAMAMLIQDKNEGGKRAKVALSYLRRGKSLADAGAKAGLFIGLDAALIKVAEAGGTNAAVFRQLAEFYEEKACQVRQIKSRLVLPITIFLLAIFIQPVPTLILGKITFVNYLGITIGFLLPLALLIFILLHLSHWLHSGFLKPFESLWDKIQIKIPYFGYWYVRRSLRDFMRSLGMMLQAGLPIFEALPKAYAVVENTVLRQQLQKISTHLHAGDTFAEAFSRVKDVNLVVHGLISTGEQAGSLAEMMLHYVKLESETLTMHNEMLAAWIPRVIYAGIVVWIVYGILSAGSLMSQVPEH